MPALIVNGNIKVSTSSSEVITLGIGTGTFTQAASKTLTFANGTGANKIGQCYSVSKTAAAAADTYTLSAIVDGLGRTIVFTTIRMLYLTHDGVVDGQPLLVGNAATQPWPGPFSVATTTHKVTAGGVLIFGGPLATAYPVTVGDKLKIDPGANSIPYTLHILGE